MDQDFEAEFVKFSSFGVSGSMRGSTARASTMRASTMRASTARASTARASTATSDAVGGITLTQSDKWMKEAKVFDKKLTTTDTAVCFKKQRKGLRLSLEDYIEFLKDLCHTKKVDFEHIKKKMADCGSPKVYTESKDSKSVRRLTDVSMYTGTHKQRFDESGKGRGREGRLSIDDNSGYVTGYKDANTFDEKKKL